MAERWEERQRSDFKEDRDYRERGERGAIDRAGDEVRSWFGDDDAARRRRMDEVRDESRGRDRDYRGANAGERAWDRTRETIRDVTDRDRDGRRGFAEWNDNDRPWDRSRYRGASYGDTWERDRYAARETYAAPRWSPSPGTDRWQATTNYAGRGPRGYKRGDERIREDICDRLTDDPKIDASDVDVQVNTGEVTLAGSVRTRDEKRFAEDAVEAVSGVREVNNHLKVRPPDEVIGTARSGASVLGLTETPPPPAPPKGK